MMLFLCSHKLPRTHRISDQVCRASCWIRRPQWRNLKKSNRKCLWTSWTLRLCFELRNFRKKRPSYLDFDRKHGLPLLSSVSSQIKIETNLGYFQSKHRFHQAIFVCPTPLHEIYTVGVKKYVIYCMSWSCGRILLEKQSASNDDQIMSIACCSLQQPCSQVLNL